MSIPWCSQNCSLRLLDGSMDGNPLTYSDYICVHICIFVPSTTYLGIIVAYILLLAGESGCFKARPNGSVGWVEHHSGTLSRVMCLHSALNTPRGKHLVCAVNCLYLCLGLCF